MTVRKRHPENTAHEAHLRLVVAADLSSTH